MRFYEAKKQRFQDNGMKRAAGGNGILLVEDVTKTNTAVEYSVEKGRSILAKKKVTRGPQSPRANSGPLSSRIGDGSRPPSLPLFP